MIIQDDFLTKEELKTIEQDIVNNDSFPWYFSSIVLDGNYSDAVSPWFGHIMIKRYNHEEEEPTVNSEMWSFFEPILIRFCKVNNINYSKVYRAALNRTLSSTNSEFFTNPHVDHNSPHNNLIIYLNDCSGNTVLFNEKLEPEIEVKPKAGRVLCFDGSTQHTFRPTGHKENRAICVITFN